MSKNIKIYLVWFLLNTLYLLGTVFYIKIQYNRNYLLCFIIGVLILLGYYIVLSWIKNCVRCVFWLSQKYNLLIARVFPFCLDFSFENLKVSFDKAMLDIGNVYTYPKLANKDIEKYIADSNKIGRLEKRGHVVLIILSSCLLSIINWQVAAINMILGVSTFVFLNVESDNIFMGSLYDSLENGNLRWECFYGVVLETTNKDKIYGEYNKNIIPQKDLSIRQRRIIEGMLIDSIIEKKDYISEQWYEALFVIFSSDNLQVMNVYNRLLFLFPLYCQIFEKGELGARELVEIQVSRLEKIYPEWALHKLFRLRKYDYYEIWDYRNNSIVYRNKIECLKRIGERNER